MAASNTRALLGLSRGQLKAIFSYTGPLFVSDSVVDKLKRAHRDRVRKELRMNFADALVPFCTGSVFTFLCK